MPDMKRICRRFTRFLHDGVRAVKLAGYKVKTPAEVVEKLIVFYALERCRDIVSDGAGPIYCHFTLPEIPDAAEKAKYRKEIDAIRGFHMKDPDATELSEYIVDFSFSTLSLKQLFGDDPSPINRKFRLLLAAESELHPTSRQRVLDDFAKLAEVKSPIKIMVYKARQGQPKQDLIGLFQDILRRHDRYDPAGEPDWLFVGIPGSAEWSAQAEVPEGLNRHVHIVRPGSDPAEIEEQPLDWWAWQPAEDEE